MRDPIGRGKRGPLGALAFVAVLAMLAAAAPAANAFGITNFSAQPAARRRVPTATSRSASTSPTRRAGLKDLTVHLPPGLIGNPLATPTCTEAKLKADNCPARSDVGDAVNNVIVKPLGLLPIPLTVNGQVYNVEPRNGEPARFGIVLDPSPVPGLGAALPKIVLQQTARLRPGDFGLDTSLNDIPRSAKIAGVSTPLEVTGVSSDPEGQDRRQGLPPQPDLLRRPAGHASTPTPTTTQTATAQDQFTTTNCNALPFSPKFSAKIKQTSSRSPRPGRAVDDDLADDRGGRPEEGGRDAPEGDRSATPRRSRSTARSPDFDAGNCAERHDRRSRRGRLAAAGRAARGQRLPGQPGRPGGRSPTSGSTSRAGSR